MGGQPRTDETVSRTLDRLIKEKANKSPGKDLHQGSIDNPGTSPMMVVQYRGKESLIFANIVWNILKAPVFLNTRKLKISLLKLNSSLLCEQDLMLWM